MIYTAGNHNPGGSPEKSPRHWWRLLGYLPVATICILVVVFVLKGGLDEVGRYLRLISEYPWLSFAVIMGLYLLKSISFGIPFAFLFTAVGSIYPLGWALLINLCGIYVNLQIPYIAGWFSGKRFVDWLSDHNPKLNRIEEMGSRSGIMLPFMLKFLGKIPHEITNALLGALHIPYPYYIAGSLLGLSPSLIAVTLVGSTATEPGSAGFILSVAAVLVIVVLSYLLYRWYFKHKPTV